MNILYLCDEYPPGRHGGIGTLVQQLARAMVHRGHNVVVAGFYDLGYGGKDRFEDEGVQVYRFRRNMDSRFFADKDSLKVRIAYRLLQRTGVFQKDITKSLERYSVFLEGLIKQHEIEIAEMPDFNEYVRFCTKYTPFPKLSIPVVVKLNGSVTYFLKEESKPVPLIVYEMERQILQQADAVVSVSEYTARKTANYLSYNKNIPILRNGIDTSASYEAKRKKEGSVIFSGTLVAKKGIYQLLKAWNIVNREMPEAELWVYGKGNQAKAISILSETARPSVIFKGHVQRQELMEQLASAQVAIFPSYAEAFSLAVMEAMAAGTAVINSERTSGPEIVKDNETGLLADPDKPEEMAEKLIYLLQNPDICNHLASAGANYVRAKLDISVIAAQHILFYKHLLSIKKHE